MGAVAGGVQASSRWGQQQDGRRLLQGGRVQAAACSVLVCRHMTLRGCGFEASQYIVIN